MLSRFVAPPSSQWRMWWASDHRAQYRCPDRPNHKKSHRSTRSSPGTPDSHSSIQPPPLLPAQLQRNPSNSSVQLLTTTDPDHRHDPSTGQPRQHHSIPVNPDLTSHRIEHSEPPRGPRVGVHLVQRLVGPRVTPTQQRRVGTARTLVDGWVWCCQAACAAVWMVSNSIGVRRPRARCRRRRW